MNYLKNLKWEMILFSLVSIVLGILMFFYPSQIINTVCIVLASILFILGVRYLLEYRRNSAIENFYKYELVAGIALILGGIIVLCCMKLILSFITYLIAIIIIISGLMKVENALDLKKMGNNWIPLMIFAIICIMLGISVLMMPMDNNDNGTSTASGFLIQASGIIFAVTGFIDLVTTLSVSGKIKRWTSERKTTILGEDGYDEIIVDIQDDIDDK
ncbi:MAG: hypothetical protein HFG30_08240 [Eubacterium sp.]|jgi:uncharacterized membrane protein HdeD (DUF308 family)|nr:hypothetical protein [Eubacterium sp.]